MRNKRIAVLALLVAALAAMPGYRQVVQLAETMGVSGAPMTLVIDAGHGGMDGGTSAPDGTLERDINLEIAQALQAEAERYGIRVVMTRKSTAGLLAPDNPDGRWSKVEDMRERQRIIREADADLVLSIHLNHFRGDGSVRGIQVFYPDEHDSTWASETETLARSLQAAVNQSVSGDDDRVAVRKHDIYLFRTAEQPTLLIECGFMSNQADMDRLKTADYRQKLAVCILQTVAEQYGLQRPKQENIHMIDSRTKQ